MINDNASYDNGNNSNTDSDSDDHDNIMQQDGGNHLSNTTCLTHVFFKSGEHFVKLW